MFDLMVLAARPNDWTHEQFMTWWRGEHAEVTYPLRACCGGSTSTSSTR